MTDEDIQCPVCDENLIKATHNLWDYDCPRCQRSFTYKNGYLHSKFETIPRKFKVTPTTQNNTIKYKKNLKMGGKL